jgi:hypothetical protein
MSPVSTLAHVAQGTVVCLAIKEVTVGSLAGKVLMDDAHGSSKSRGRSSLKHNRILDMALEPTNRSRGESMFRKRRSLGLALLAFGTALSLCTLAAQGWAQHEIGTELVNASGTNNWICNTPYSVIASHAIGFDASWNPVSGCEAEDGQGNTQTTTCSPSAVNIEILLQEFSIRGGGSFGAIHAWNLGSWASPSLNAPGTVNVCQGGFGVCGGNYPCGNVYFIAEAAGYN